jgi:hypothetical protein
VPDYVVAESRDLLDRLFGVKLAPLIAHFSERQEISEDEIDEPSCLNDRFWRIVDIVLPKPGGLLLTQSGHCDGKGYGMSGAIQARAAGRA